MKTSWKKTKQLEDYLLLHGEPEEALLLEAQLVLEPSLQDTLQWQQRAYATIHQYGRQQLRGEIKAVQDQLFYQSKYQVFQRKIRSIFTKS